MNLTVMLVLTTMFSSINALLPKTSYMKMSDIWYSAIIDLDCINFSHFRFIFNLFLPFMEVCILVRKETLRLDNAPINHHGKVNSRAVFTCMNEIFRLCFQAKWKEQQNLRKMH